MASIDWLKNRGGTGEAFARMNHNTRRDGLDVNFNNLQINKSLSHLNYVIGADNLEQRTAKEEIERLNKRIEELDRLKPPKRIRKDRVTTVSFEMTTPDNLPSDLEENFFELVYDEIAKLCGGWENVSFGYVHVDEVHEYFNPDNKQINTSRHHMHMQGIVWTDEYGVNGKHFVTRDRMRLLNQRINERCIRELGVPFLKNEVSQYDRDYLVVEELKRRSLKELTELNKELENQVDVLRTDIENIQWQIEIENNRYEQVQQAREIADREYKRISQKLTDLEEKLANTTTNDMVGRLEKENDALKNENSTLKNAIKTIQLVWNRAEHFLQIQGKWQLFKRLFDEDRELWDEFERIRADANLFGLLPDRFGISVNGIYDDEEEIVFEDEEPYIDDERAFLKYDDDFGR